MTVTVTVTRIRLPAPSLVAGGPAVARNIVLPWSPSTNHYWRHVGPRVLVSAEGRAYRQTVQAILFPCKPMSGRLAVRIDAHPPDRRVRDIDNLLKSLLDALRHAGVYHDDSQIDDLHVVRRGVVPGGSLTVHVSPLEDLPS